jgi:hypothetical protein
MEKQTKILIGLASIGVVAYFVIKPKFAIKDDKGQWAHPKKVTQINSNVITMQGVNYPVLGISDTADIKLMMPNKDYIFNGNKVTEYPIASNWLIN